jgi:pimeloyl-ACP methyl ester carboxylesterase
MAAPRRAVAFDLRGHGAGLPLRRRFSIEECADDVRIVADALGLPPFIAVGYSLGGLVAQALDTKGFGVGDASRSPVRLAPVDR